MVQQDCAICVSGGFGGSFFKPRHGIVPCKSLHLYCIKAQITPMIKIMNKISNYTFQTKVLFSISIKSGNYICTSEKLFPSKATSKPMQILWKTGSELILEQERKREGKKKKRNGRGFCQWLRLAGWCVSMLWDEASALMKMTVIWTRPGPSAVMGIEFVVKSSANSLSGALCCGLPAVPPGRHDSSKRRRS